jgi:hypothetical protein
MLMPRLSLFCARSMMLAGLLSVSSALWAQSAPPDAPTSFPPEATTPTAAALQTALAGKVFNVKLADGVTWRLQYQTNGYWFINTSRGFADTGKWSTQDGQLCGGGKRIKDTCNAMRLQGGTLYMQRDSGEVVVLVAE